MKTTSDLHLGLLPKCKIQFSLAPRSSTTSAPPMAVLLAAATFNGCESGRTPFPMGVGRNGNWVDSMRWRTCASARAYADPLPITTSGADAFLSRETAFSMTVGDAMLLGQSGI